MSGLEGAILLAVLIAGVVVLGRIEADKTKARNHEKRQQLVRDLVDGRDPYLYRIAMPDETMRRVQILGESARLVRTTNSKATRAGRAVDARRMLGELDEFGWCDIDGPTRDHVREVAERCAQQAIALNAAAEAEKHLRAVQRAVKPETQLKYARLAQQEIESALAQISDPELAEVLRAVLLQLDVS